MDDIDALRATAHPLRLRMLSLLTGEPMSASDVARVLGISPANASYHLRVLERTDLIRLVDEVKIRGGVARRYRHESSSAPFAERDVDATARQDPSANSAYIEALTEELRRRATLQDGGPRLTTDADLWVDPALWREIVTAVGDASARLHAGALPVAEDGAVHVSMTAALFRMTDAAHHTDA